jgi:hypothetical protein
MSLVLPLWFAVAKMNLVSASHPAKAMMAKPPFLNLHSFLFGTSFSKGAQVQTAKPSITMTSPSM